MTIVDSMNILSQLPVDFGHPTPEDLEKAHHDVMARGYLRSKNPKIFDIQVKTMALGYVAARRKNPTTPPETQAERCRKVSQKLMGIQSRYAGISFHNPNLIETALIRFLKQTKAISLLLLGGTGCGKTYGAICWVTERANWQKSLSNELVLNAKFVDAYEIWLALSHKEKEFLRQIETIKYLIVDDLGTDSHGFKAQDLIGYIEHLYSVRHRNNLSTVMTCNADKEEFKKLYGDRLISRFNEIGEYFESSDGDFRQAIAGRDY